METDGTPTWSLQDVEERAAANPRSFFIPERAEREAVEPGTLVKLIFPIAEPVRAALGDDAPAAERMWVRVTDRDDGGYVGRLANEPVVIPDLAEGDRIELAAEHIAAVHGGAPDPHAGRVAFASESLFEGPDGRPGVTEVGAVAFEPDDAGRSTADGREVSGWSLFAGDETAAQLDDPDRIRLADLGWLLARYPELADLVDGHDGTGAHWIRDGDELTRIPTD